jgi:UDP-N-acetylmuramate--alanine ligase
MPPNVTPSITLLLINRNKTRGKYVHFIGIGGIGMSALARWFLAQNWVVSGSDVAATGITRGLKKEGVKVKIGHKNANLSPKTGLVVYSLAIKPDNPELRAAGRLKIPALSYPEVIGELTRVYKTVAVAGAHGKSTTTALVALILKKAGVRPTVILGTNLKEFGGKNFLAGRSPSTFLGASSPYLVLEADEFGRAFLRYSPTLAVVTNIDREHLDTYKNLAGVKRAFLEFLSRTKPGGTLILNKDCLYLFSQQAKIRKIAEDRNLKVLWYSIRGETAEKIKKVIKLPGAHNISNAVAAYKAGRVLGIPHKKILAAIGGYRGSWRRFEYRGACRLSHVACRVYDDYAHHPTEIKATLGAFREKFPRSPIICVFQPHQAKRLRLLFKEFAAAFGDADMLILLPVYTVAGRDRVNPLFSGAAARRNRFTSEALAAAIQKKYPDKPVFYLANPKIIGNFLKEIISRHSHVSHNSHCVVVMMGAGDIVKYTSSLLK